MGYLSTDSLIFIPSSTNGLHSRSSLKSAKYYMNSFRESDDVTHVLQSDWSAKILAHGTKIEYIGTSPDSFPPRASEKRLGTRLLRAQKESYLFTANPREP